MLSFSDSDVTVHQPSKALDQYLYPLRFTENRENRFRRGQPKPFRRTYSFTSTFPCFLPFELVT